MIKRILSLVVMLGLLFITAFADTPRPVELLDYDSVVNKEGQKHYLLLCTDQWERKGEGIGNTDGIILLTLDTHTKRVLITSFSRDILVQRPDGVMGRITFIAKNYGPEALCKIMATHFGIKVDKYILFEMSGVENIVDALGGVDITVTNAEAKYLRRYAIPADSTTPAMTFAGTYHFRGHSAVIYMRIRKVGNGDYGRNTRIRETLSKLATTAMSYDADQAADLLDAIVENIDKTNISTAELLEAMSIALDLRGAPIEQLKIPDETMHKLIGYSGMIVMDIDYPLARKAIDEFMSDSFVVEE